MTVEDVAEALHLDSEYVARELEALYEEHKEARLAGVIRELEEPLYRVERTGHTPPDPLGNPLFKLRSVQILAERSKARPVLPRRKETVHSSERLGQIVSHATLILLLVLVLILIGVNGRSLTLKVRSWFHFQGRRSRRLKNCRP